MESMITLVRDSSASVAPSKATIPYQASSRDLIVPRPVVSNQEVLSLIVLPHQQ